MKNLFVVCGCGQLAWCRRRVLASDSGSAGYIDGDEWSLEDDPPPNLSLSEELDGGAGLTLQRDLPPIRLDFRRGLPGGTAVLVEPWEEFVGGLADLVSNELEGAGVVVTPRGWTESRRGQEFLRPWRDRGWRWSPLEEVLASTFSSDQRIVSGGKVWLRITQGADSVVVPNGAEAAHALAMAPKVLEQTLKEVHPDLAKEWLAKERPRSGWFTLQKIVRRINDALRDGARSVELANPALPLFGFSSEAQAAKFEELRRISVTLALPVLSAAPWWEQIAEPGVLKQHDGRPLHLGLDWGSSETVLLGQLVADSAPEDLQALHTYLRFNTGRPFRLVAATALDKALDASMDLALLLSSVQGAAGKQEATGASARASDAVIQVALETLPEAAAAEPPVPAVTVPAIVASRGAFSYDPHYFVLEDEHLSGFLRVFVDGARIAPENVLAERRRDGRTAYRLSGVFVPRGSVVRVDFEPTGAE